MEELESKWDHLSLTEEENSIIELEPASVDLSEERGARSLVGRLWAERRVGKEVIRSTMAKIWRVGRGFGFQEIATNLFVIMFENQEDKLRILEGRPWLFDNWLFVLKPFDGFVSPQWMNFDKEVFWVRLNNLPLALMN
ncbi:uncharacterized protein LOC122306500 [Carya illinoinensis]|uniref:uncharacterized protein LOC122306500 n=1 Tax=Carya illinoinensis TaxID=32201 RepID=UPI001C7217DF|nr:uncharacterized protein LOC122306500 [Carya illinoinensis]